MTNPEVTSRGSFRDKFVNFSIDVNETKELPNGWRNRPGIIQALSNGMLKFETPQIDVPKDIKGKGQIIKKIIEEPEAVIVGEEEIKEERSISPVADDYLGRNATTVRKAIASDDLKKSFLKDLETIEKKGKRRNSILDIIRRKLKGE